MTSRRILESGCSSPAASSSAAARKNVIFGQQNPEQLHCLTNVQCCCHNSSQQQQLTQGKPMLQASSSAAIFRENTAFVISSTNTNSISKQAVELKIVSMFQTTSSGFRLASQPGLSQQLSDIHSSVATPHAFFSLSSEMFARTH